MPPPTNITEPTRTQAHFSSQALPARKRFAALRELSHELMGLDLQPHPDAADDAPCHFSTAVTGLGGGMVYARTVHTPLRALRTKELVRDGSDDVYLSRVDNGVAGRSASGEFIARPGALVLMSKARPHEGLTPPGRSCSTAGIVVPRASLLRLLPHLEEAPFRLLPANTAGAAMALDYAALIAQAPQLTPAQLQAATSHLQELVASVIDPHWGTAQPPGGDAQALPRLALIQRDIRAHIDWPGLSLAFIARQHHLTPRQIQRLFAQQGGSYSDFVARARMERARALLADPREGHRRVLDIALDCGYDDVTAFSRAFRRHFGMSPSDARNAVPDAG
ncbi:MAG: helix-turn-helix transcriptional regulator [Comamonas sp.]